MGEERKERRRLERERAKKARKALKGVSRTGEEFQKFLDGWDIVNDGGWPEWSPFVLSEKIDDDSEFLYVYVNSRYQVFVAFGGNKAGWPLMAHLSIKSHDKRPARDWRDMQRLKNELCGTDAEGVELYPAESRLMDEANQYHIFVLHPEAGRFPFGQTFRSQNTPEELAKMSPPQVFKRSDGKVFTAAPKQREFEPHHNADDCKPKGIIPWPAFASVESEEDDLKDDFCSSPGCGYRISSKTGKGCPDHG